MATNNTCKHISTIAIEQKTIIATHPLCVPPSTLLCGVLEHSVLCSTPFLHKKCTDFHQWQLFHISTNDSCSRCNFIRLWVGTFSTCLHNCALIQKLNVKRISLKDVPIPQISMIGEHFSSIIYARCYSNCFHCKWVNSF